MKKFSKITNQKVNEEPKVDNKINEEDEFKSKVMNLMDQFLSIRTYGPIGRYYNAASIKISGKEMLAEALLDLLKDDKKESQTKILEDLKSQTGDWKVIDDKIEEINSEKTLIGNRNKFNNLLENYPDSDTLKFMIEENCQKISNQKTISDYIKLTLESKLDSNVKNDLINIYNNRLNQIINLG